MVQYANLVLSSLLIAVSAYRADPQFMAISVIVAVALFLTSSSSQGSGQVNHKIGLDKPKVVDMVQFSEVAGNEKLVLCRCWKSKKFPYCDGAHVKHNKETGDNVGPLVILGGKKK
jgi:CDGSH-type Zn-finger protein